MREEWGVHCFKLDANYRGAIQEDVHFVENASRIEACRHGMEAILSGCDENTVVLGCNAPIWPSFGLVTAQHTSGDKAEEPISLSVQLLKQTRQQVKHSGRSLPVVIFYGLFQQVKARFEQVILCEYADLCNGQMIYFLVFLL
jgi:hypothetical protein